MNIVYKVVKHIKGNIYGSAYARQRNKPLLTYTINKWTETPEDLKALDYL
jgi:hypothetical protein